MLLKLFRKPESVRNLVFGTEDSLVSTVGFISGVAFAGVASKTIILSGVILVFVEAFSMAVGALVSSNSAQEVREHREVSYGHSTANALIMFFSYVVSGICVLLPYAMFPVRVAFFVSMVIALVLLFTLGVFSGRMAGIAPFRKGLSVAGIGAVAILIGVGVGSLFNM